MTTSHAQLPIKIDNNIPINEDIAKIKNPNQIKTASEANPN